MKNISRRVFIKGMAVAAVATAASTVLTGCKLPVTPEEPEVVPSAVKTFTFTDEAVDESVKLTIDGVVKYADIDQVALSVKVENDTSASVTLKNATITSDVNNYGTGNYGIAITFKDAVDTDDVTIPAAQFSVDGTKSTVFTDAGVVANAGFNKDGVLVVNTSSTRDWKKVTIVFALYKKVTGVAGSSMEKIVEKEYVLEA